MTISSRLAFPFAALFAALTLLVAGGASTPQTNEQIAEATVTKIEASFEKSKAKIIAGAEKAILQINAAQMRMTPEAKVEKVAAAAIKAVNANFKSGKKTLETTANTGIKTLTKKKATDEEKAIVTDSRDANIEELQAVADDCVNAINTAFAD